MLVILKLLLRETNIFLCVNISFQKRLQRGNVPRVKAVAKVDGKAVLAESDVDDAASDDRDNFDVHAHRRARGPYFALVGKFGVRHLWETQERAKIGVAVNHG